MDTAQVLDRETSDDQESGSAPVETRHGVLAITPSGARKFGAVLATIGLISVATVATALLGPHVLDRTTAPDPAREPIGQLTTPVDASTVHTSGPVQISLQNVTYGPGQSSGWHIHPGVHLVSILSGTLTVYAADCQPQTFGPGQPYIGGEEVHVARNETDAPVEMAVTYVTRPGQAMEHFRLDAPAPANCAVA